jgi:AAA family ATP:ADP antiporter
MLPRLRRFFDLRAGEARPLAWCASYVALTVASFLLAKPIKDSLFLQQYGPYKLVYAFVAVPIVLSLFVPAYGAVAARIGQRAVTTGSLLFLASNVLAFWWGFTHEPAPWLSAAFYVWVSCYGVIAPVQAWQFANTVFDTRQAKRLFGLVGAGASVGAILGGLLASVLVRPVGGTVNLLLVLAGLVAATALQVNLAWHVRRPDLRPPRRAVLSLGQTLSHIRATPYLARIAALVFLVAVVTQWTQFLFKLGAASRFQGDADALAGFFGTFNFITGLIALTVQLTLTGPVLHRFGIGFAVLLLPALLGVGSTLILATSAFGAVLLTNGLDQTLRFSIDKAAFEVLYVPVEARVKGSVKNAIDLLVNRFADGVGGFLLGLATQGFSLVLFALPGVHLGTRGIAAMALVVIGLWVGVAFLLRRDYVRYIRESVVHNYNEFKRVAAVTLDRTAIQALAGKIATGRADDILSALDVFAAEHAGALHPAVRGLLAHPDARVRQRAVEVLDACGDRSVAGEVERLLRDPDLDTRTAALLYLAHQTGADPLERVRELGEFADFSIQAGTIAFLSRPGPTQNLEAAEVLLDAMIADRGNGGRRPRLEAARLLGRLPPAFHAQLAHLLDDEDAEVVRAAAESAGRLRDPAFIRALITRLGQPVAGPASADALVAIGAAAVGRLGAALEDDAVPIQVRHEIPDVLVRIGSVAALDALMQSLLERDASLRFRIIRALNQLRVLHPGVPIDRLSIETMLGAEIMGHYRSYQVLGRLSGAFEGSEAVVAAQEQSIQQERERIFRLMGLLWPEFDLQSVWVALQSGSGAVRANALELLEAELHPDLRNLVLPLFDGQVPTAERIRKADELVGSEISHSEEAVRTWLASEDAWLKSCGVYAVGVLGLESLAAEIATYAASPDPLLRETVRAAQARLAARRAAAASLEEPEEEADWTAHDSGSGMG